MNGWTKIETGWYRHPSGAVVQRWGNYIVGTRKTAWLAWRPTDKDDDLNPFLTMREAMEYALGVNGQA